MMKLKKNLLTLLILLAVGYGISSNPVRGQNLNIDPPVTTIMFPNGNTYTNAMLEANPAGWLGGVASDIVLLVTGLPATGLGRASLTDDVSTAYTTDQATFAVFSKSGQTAMDIADATCDGCGYKNYDVVRSVGVALVGNEVLNTTNYAAYMRNQEATGILGLSKNAVNYQGFMLCEVNGAACWNVNTIMMDSDIYAASGGTDISMAAFEADFIITSDLTAVFGLYLVGNSIEQPIVANAVSVNPLGDPFGSDSNPIHWIASFLSGDGAAQYGLVLGATARSGLGIPSQQVRMNYFEDDGTGRVATLQVSGTAPAALNLGSSSGAIGFSVQGDIYQLQEPVAHYMGLSSIAALIADTDDNLFIAPGAWTAIALGNGSVELAILSPTSFSNDMRPRTSLVSELPTCNVARLGSIRVVTNASSPTYNSVVTGGGLITVPVHCDSSSWRS